jgi:hypothetical protein
MRSRIRSAVAPKKRWEFESPARRVTKAKRNKEKFWCHECSKVGHRTEALAKIAARVAGKRMVPCPQGYGWHMM